MPWQQESPWGAAANAAASFIQGQQQAKEKQQQTQEQQYMDKVYASHLAAEERISEDRISEQARAAELKRVSDEERNQIQQLEAQFRGKIADERLNLMEQQLSASIQEHKDAIQASITNREAQDQTEMAVEQMRASTQAMIAQMMVQMHEIIHDTPSGTSLFEHQTGKLTPLQEGLKSKIDAATKANPNLTTHQLRAAAKQDGYSDADINAVLPKTPAPPKMNTQTWSQPGSGGFSSTPAPGNP